MGDEQLLEWIKGQYRNTIARQSFNAEVEWDRRIPEPVEEVTEEQMIFEDPQFKIPDRPEKKLS